MKIQVKSQEAFIGDRVITRPYDAADGQKEGMATARRCGSFLLITTPHASIGICMYLPQDHWT